MAPREKNPNKSDNDLKRKRAYFKRMFPGFKKKATELPVLCDNSLAFICRSPDKDLFVWPENPQAVAQIVSQFKAMSDEKRKKHASDLNDFPNFKGSSGDELRTYLSQLKSHIAGVRRQKDAILKRTSDKTSSIVRKAKPCLMKTVEEGLYDKDLIVSDNAATVSDHKAGSSENQLGFGGLFDELGYVVRGSHEPVSKLELCAASKVTSDIIVFQGTEADSSPLDPFTLGFPGGGYVPNNDVWDSSWMNLEFSSTLFADDWRVSGYTYDSLLGATDSFYGEQFTDKLGAKF